MDDPTVDDEGLPGDPGLARERTALAWNRTGLAALVAVAIILRRLWPLRGDTSVVILILLGVGAALWAVGMQATRRARSDPDGSGAIGRGTFRLMTIGTLVLAFAAFLVGLLSVP